jgi:hypothetical protein
MVRAGAVQTWFMWVKIGRIWRPTTRGNIEIIEQKTHASPKQFKISHMKQ